MSQKSNRILIFSTAYLPYIGGAELAVKEITNRLPEIEFDLITAKLKRKLPDFERIGNLNVYRLGVGNKISDKLFLPTFGSLKAISLHKRNRYNLIHGIMASHGSAAAYLFKVSHSKIPFILTLQEGDLDRNSRFDRFWQKRIIQRADTITVISNYLGQFARRFNQKAPIYLIPNGVDLNKVKNLELKSKDQDKKVVISVSRLVPKNGLDILVHAAKFLKPLIRNSKFLIRIIGDGPERNKLEKLAEDLELAEDIEFLGEIPNEHIYQYLVSADVFVRPSRSEGLGTAFLEAMSCGTPVVATRVGGISDFLKDGETGLFCELNNPENLASRIAKILKDKELKSKLIENSYRLVCQKYNWGIIANQMRKVYEKSL